MVSRGVYSQSEFDASALYIDGADWRNVLIAIPSRLRWADIGVCSCLRGIIFRGKGFKI
jgi:hypothetical protein